MGSSHISDIADRVRGLCKSGDYAQAATLSEDILNDPALSADLARAVGTDLAVAGELHAAKRILKRAVELEPRNARAHYQLGTVFFQLGKTKHAIANLKTASKLDPGLVAAHVNLAVIHNLSRAYDTALKHADHALAIDPELAEAHAARGAALYGLERHDAAQTALETAIKLNPSLPDPHSNLMELLDRLNRLDELSATVDRAAICLGERHAAVRLRRGQIALRKGDPESAYDATVGIEAKTLPLPLQILRLDIMGKSLDRLERLDHAADVFAQSKDLVFAASPGLSADTKGYCENLKTIAATWNAETSTEWSIKTAPENQPTISFLMGFPRSGTTLLARILDAHPKIIVFDEKPMLQRIKSSVDTSLDVDGLDRLDQKKIENLATDYWSLVDTESPERSNGSIVLDKNPLHLSSLGLIRRVFPEAPLILLLRHPCDAVLSVFMNSFRIGSLLTRFRSVEEIADLYDALFSQWVAVSQGHPSLHIVKYEDLITGIEPDAVRLVSALGLEWDPAVLTYRDKTPDRRINTPSYNQVSEPIYSRAVNRWKNYQFLIEPVMPKLAPWIERFGYDQPQLSHKD